MGRKQIVVAVWWGEIIPHWSNPVFIRINLIMTYAWAGLFAICIGLSLYPSPVTRAYIPIFLLMGVGFPFNALYPDYHLKRCGLPSLSQHQTYG